MGEQEQEQAETDATYCLVVDETVNKIRERAVKALAKAEDAADALGKLGVETKLPTAEQLQTVADETRKSMESVAASPGMLCPQLPEVSHRKLVDRALARRKPFDSHGRNGYRDCLLWETVLELVADNDVILVSDDEQAFAGAGGELAPELGDEVREVTDSHTVRLLGNPQAVANELVDQDVEARAALEKLLLEESFRTILDEALDDALPGLELPAREASKLELGANAYYVHLIGLNSLGHVEAQTVFTARTGEALAELDVWVAATVSASLPGDDVLALRGRDDVWLLDRDWSDVMSSHLSVMVALARFFVVRVATRVDLRRAGC